MDEENKIKDKFDEEKLKQFDEEWLKDIRKLALLKEQIREERKKVRTTEELIKMNEEAIEWAKSIGAEIVYVDEPVDMKVVTKENINEIIDETNKEKVENENNQD